MIVEAFWILWFSFCYSWAAAIVLCLAGLLYLKISKAKEIQRKTTAIVLWIVLFFMYIFALYSECTNTASAVLAGIIWIPAITMFARSFTRSY